jgi:hypothetical protein
MELNSLKMPIFDTRYYHIATSDRHGVQDSITMVKSHIHQEL